MKFFYWNSKFEIGIDVIDEQHRRLMELVNELASAVTEGGRLPEAEALVRGLLDYAAKHFRDEEVFLTTSSLDDVEKAAHRRAHREFADEVAKIAGAGRLHRSDVAERVLDFLTNWLISHILGADRRIAVSLEAPTGDGPSEIIEQIPLVERVLIDALLETERRFRLISDFAPALIWVCEPDGRRGFYNHAWTTFVGLDEEAALDCDGLDFVHPDDRTAYGALLERLLVAPTPVETEYRLRRSDGDYGWILERIMPRYDVGGAFVGLIASATDVTAIKRSEEVLAETNRRLEAEVARRTAQLEEMTRTDPLTGIGNRRMILCRLDEEIHRARRHERLLTAVFLDLDHFKRINDGWGHGVGDAVLVAVAECLRANLRVGDLIGRHGGEEFVALLLDTGLGDAESVVERLRRTVSELVVTGLPEQITISAGLAEWRRGENGDDLLRRADRALYRAKESGRNCWRIDHAA